MRSAVWLLPFAAAMCGLARSAAWLFLPFRAARGERWRGGKFSARSAACGTCGGGGKLISASPIGCVCWWNSSWSVKKEEAVCGAWGVKISMSVCVSNHFGRRATPRRLAILLALLALESIDM